MQLVCPAGNLPALQAAVDAGADAVYAGFRDQTNARAFPGLNFSDDELRAGVRYAHASGTEVYLALNTYPDRSEEHTSELQSLMRISYAVFCLKKKTKNTKKTMIVLHLKKKK